MKKIIFWLIYVILSGLLIVGILIKLDYIHIEFIYPNKKDINSYINNGLSLEDSGLNNSNQRQDRFYYNQLSNTAKIIYDRILAEKENMKTGSYEIKFEDNTFDDILGQDDGMEILKKEYQNAVDAIRYDNLDLFYIDFTKIVLRTITYTKRNSKTYEVYLSKNDETENYFSEVSNNKEQIDKMLNEIDTKKKEILDGCQGSNYQKIQYIHNWLIDNLEYNTNPNEPHIRDVYGALINKKVVCEGYAKSFKFLLDELNIPCIIVSGTAENSEGKIERHMWNYVQINDIWYAVDVTWDDPILKNSNELPDELRYKYFCQGDNIYSNHFLSNYITEGCQEFIYPELYNKVK